MTKVIIKKHDSFIEEVEVKGHALSAKHGKDIVCAGISTVVTGICNALEELTIYNEDQITIEEGFLNIPHLIDDEKVQLICEVLVVQLKMIERSYPKYIEISFQ